MWKNQLRGLEVECPPWDSKVVGSIPGWGRQWSPCLPAWHSVFEVEIGGFDQPMIAGRSHVGQNPSMAQLQPEPISWSNHETRRQASFIENWRPLFNIIRPTSHDTACAGYKMATYRFVLTPLHLHTINREKRPTPLRANTPRLQKMHANSVKVLQMNENNAKAPYTVRLVV